MKKNKRSTPSKDLAWPELIPGILVKRYKRFMADVKLAGGEVVTAHCPNSGSMRECCEPGRPVHLSFHDNPKRKLKYTWELIEMPTSIVGVNTLIPNRLVAASIEAGLISDLSGYDDIAREVKTSDNTRLDILLSSEDGNRCYVEIKNCTLVKEGVACFPDAVTSRGLKHLVELSSLVSKGFRSVIFYVIQRMDATIFQPADHIDPDYGRKLRQVLKHGVEILVYDTRIDLKTISLNQKIPYRL
ncbi:MAG: DNA/RNA nuclease SfsA [Deltaproteobacteria bacterium]|nr:DNA/RNA nuclease SfsA [Deltaproteobacteria bacterium]